MPKTDIILALIRTKDWDGLFQHFRSASNADFRKMEVVVRERVMPQLSNQDFWEAYQHLLEYRRQAFLPCVLGVAGLAKDGLLDFRCKEAQSVARWLHDNSPESLAKIVRMALPMLVSAQQIEALFQFAGFHDERECVAVLIKESTPYAYYVLSMCCAGQPIIVSCLWLLVRLSCVKTTICRSIWRAYLEVILI